MVIRARIGGFQDDGTRVEENIILAPEPISTMDADIVTIEYEVIHGKPVIFVRLRCADGSVRWLTIRNFNPYFYVPFDEKPKGMKPYALTEYKSIFGDKLAKIITKIPADVKKLRGQFSQSFEADIPYPRRFAINEDLYCGVKLKLSGDKVVDMDPTSFHNLPLRFWCIDLEAASPPEIFPSPDKGHYPIASISLYDSFDEVIYCLVNADGPRRLIGMPDSYDSYSIEYRVYNDEKSLIKEFIEMLQEKDPDILTGWNSSRFDWPYIISRMRTLRMNAEVLSPMKKAYLRGRENQAVIKGRVIWDAFDAYLPLQNVMGKLESYTLEAVYEYEKGIVKDDYGDQIEHLWKTDLPKLAEYNISDVVATWEIIQHKNLIPFYNIFRSYVGVPLNDTLAYSKMTDVLLLREASKRGIVLPDKSREHVKDKGDLRGGVVLEPRPDIYDRVLMLDLKNLYPSIITAANISIETIRTKEGIGYHKIGDVWFTPHPMGLLPSIMQGLIAERERLKTSMYKFKVGSDDYEVLYTHQFAIKFFICSMYGYCGFSGARLYDMRLANAITWVGRTLINHSAKIARELGYDAMYGDTDSIFISIPEELDYVAVGFDIEKALNNSYVWLATNQLGIEQHDKLQIKFEKVFSPFFMKGKKNYAGILIWEEGHEAYIIKVVGMAPKRSDNSRLTRKLVKDVLTKLLEKDKKGAKELVLVAVDKFERSELIDIGIPKGIQKQLNAYKANTPWVRGSKFANAYFGMRLQAGSKPKLFYMARAVKGYPYSDAIAIELLDRFLRTVQEQDFRDAIDWDKMSDKCIRMKVEPILNSVGMDWMEVVHGTKQTTLFDFGGDKFG